MIYVCGGFDGSSRLASTECYDEKTDVWTIGEDMHVGREGAGLVSIGDHLYCIGKFLFFLYFHYTYLLWQWLGLKVICV